MYIELLVGTLQILQQYPVSFFKQEKLFFFKKKKVYQYQTEDSVIYESLRKCYPESYNNDCIIKNLTQNLTDNFLYIPSYFLTIGFKCTDEKAVSYFCTNKLFYD